MSSAKSIGFPEDPSDSSSSDTDSSSDHSSRNGRRTSSPRLSSRYNGEPDAQQVYFVSYYLDGKAGGFSQNCSSCSGMIRDPIQTEIYRKNLDPEVATWDEIVKAATAAEVLVKLDQKNQKEAKFEYQSDESEHNEDDDADAPADDGSDAEEDYIEESSKREHGGRVEASQMLAEPMRTAAIGRDEQPLMLRQQDDFMRRGLCFNCGGRGHRARERCTFQLARSRVKRCTKVPRCMLEAYNLMFFSKSRRAGWSPWNSSKILEGMPDLKEPESTWQTMQIELAFDIAEGATKSYEIIILGTTCIRILLY
ncbi:hypothetical protein K438DRAFT_1843376 [Mycena galopus ATCC 62051]|nr:hypothetical protein K438DRAFT_1843376 [Mycena galopus ATCC 62051]